MHAGNLPPHYWEDTEPEHEHFGHQGGPGWYFWDETETCAMGPYSSESEAVQEQKNYAAVLLGEG